MMCLPKLEPVWQLSGPVSMPGNTRITFNDITWLDIADLDSFSIAFSFTNENIWTYGMGEVFSWNGSASINGSVNFVGYANNKEGWSFRNWAYSPKTGVAIDTELHKVVIIGEKAGTKRNYTVFFWGESCGLVKQTILNQNNNTSNDQPLSFGDPWKRVKGPMHDFAIYNKKLNDAQIEDYIGVAIV